MLVAALLLMLSAAVGWFASDLRGLQPSPTVPASGGSPGREARTRTPRRGDQTQNRSDSATGARSRELPETAAERDPGSDVESSDSDTLIVHVVGHDGSARAAVSFIPDGTGAILTTMTASDGTARLAPLNGRGGWIAAYSVADQISARRRLDAGNPGAGAEVTLRLALVRFTGVVILTDGLSPAPGLEVTVQTRAWLRRSGGSQQLYRVKTARTDDDGRFVVSVPDGSSFTVNVEPTQSTPPAGAVHRRFPAGTRDARIVLDRVVFVRPLAHDADTGAQLPFDLLRLRKRLRTGPAEVVFRRPRPSGDGAALWRDHYELRAPRTVEVCVDARGYDASQWVTLQPDPATGRVDLTVALTRSMADPPRLRLLIRHPDGKLVRGASLAWFTSSNQSQRESGTAREDGAYDVELPRGTTKISIEPSHTAPHWRQKRISVTADEGAVVTREVTVEPAGAIQVYTRLRPQLERVADRTARIVARYAAGISSSGERESYWQAASLEPGRYIVSWVGSSGLEPVGVDVTLGETTRVSPPE